jgi:hypothetical protein
VLSVIGLALDIVGALTLAFGLFEPRRGPFPGEATPDKAAADVRTVRLGAVLLASGFFLQSLAYFDVTVDASVLTRVLVGLVVLVAAGLLALATRRTPRGPSGDASPPADSPRPAA